MMERERAPSAFVDAREVAAHVHLMEFGDRGQSDLAMPLDALDDAHIAGRSAGLVSAGLVFGIDQRRHWEGEEETGAAKGHEAVEDDGPPFFGDAADVLLLSGVISVEHVDQGVHGREEGVIIDDSDPLSRLIALAVQELDEREVAVCHVVILIYRFNDCSLDTQIAHVRLQLGHFLLIWSTVLF